MSGPRLRILIVGVNYAPETTGIAPYTTAMAEGLRQAGHQVRVITSFPHYPQWRVQQAPDTGRSTSGVQVRRLRHYVPSQPTGLRRIAFELSFGVRAMLSGWGRPQVLLCISPALFSTAMVTARARLTPRRPTVGVVVQDLYSQGIVETGTGGAGLGRLMRFVESAVARSADGVSVIHPRFRTTTEESLRVPAERVTVIRNWTHVAPPTEFVVEDFRASLGWSTHERVVLHSGAMGLKQGLENVVEAARLADQAGSNVRFVLLGNGSQLGHLRERARGVDRIQFLDALGDDDYAKALVAADVLLVNERPGVRDMAVPSKLTSYFGAGRPVVAATDRGSATAEELRNAGAGLVVDPGEPQQLLTAVVGLTAEETAAFGEAGKEYCATVLSERTALDEYARWVSVLDVRSREKTARGDRE